MSLPEGFLFSQSSLQDYVDCQRRFQLRYLLHQSWPAVEAEPYLENERRMDQGDRFHQIIHQHLVGLPEERITQSLSGDEVMQGWWANYLQNRQAGSLSLINRPENQLFEEITLSIPLDKFRLIAKYDLLIIDPDGSLLILDWKTSRQHPRHRWLEERLQTHVYPYVLASAGGTFLSGSQPDPAKIEMIYWFTNQPEQPESFAYSQAKYAEDQRFLLNLVTTIDRKVEKIYPLTPDVRRCLYCTYRSLCNRGVTPGDMEHLEEWTEPESAEDVSIDFDQIGEIEL